MTYIRDASGISRQDLDSNKNVHESFYMNTAARGADCGVVQWVKRGTLRGFGHMMRMTDSYFIMGMCWGSIEGWGVRERPAVRWVNRVDE